MAYKRLIMTCGLPGSGKSTWAEQERVKLEGQGAKVLISNKDEIRKALTATGWTWSKEAEKDVIKFQNQQIKGAFSHGTHVVIVADTNFGKHKERLQGLAKHCEADFEVKNFASVPLQTCIERDAQRPEALRVGPEVIKDMYNKYLAVQEVRPYVPNTRRNPAIICDLDGTLALHVDRSPYDYNKLMTDLLNAPIADIISIYANDGYSILYTSGRDASCRDLTIKWLEMNRLPWGEPHQLIMRPAGDNRKDYIVKQELFDQYIRDEYNVKFVLDDRNQVVAMWRRMGLTCLQVAEGDF